MGRRALNRASMYRSRVIAPCIQRSLGPNAHRLTARACEAERPHGRAEPARSVRLGYL